MPDGDTGNPWLALPKTYKGQYRVTLGDGVTMDSDVVMLSSDNDVSFTGAITAENYVMGSPLCMLPLECTPMYDTYIPVCITVDDNTTISFAYLSSNRELILLESYDNVKVELNGVTYNIGCNYYRGGE